VAGIFRSIKRVLTGQVVRQVDMKVMGGNAEVSLRVKREGNKPDDYVVLAIKASGNYQYLPFEAEEFDRFVENAISIRDGLTRNASADGQSDHPAS
jgi:hypothetical protein